MATALAEQMNAPELHALSFEERLGLRVDREMTYRDNRRISARRWRAKRRHNAGIEELDYRSQARPGPSPHPRLAPLSVDCPAPTT